MIRSILKITAFLYSVSVCLWANASEDLLKKIDNIRSPGGNFSFDLNLESDDGSAIGMSVFVKDQSKTLVRYTKPMRSAGRSILFVDRNMWVYVPGSRRAIRISPKQQIMGGVSSADIARAVYSLDYETEGVESETSEDGTELTKVLLRGKTKGAAYAKIDLYLDKEDNPLYALHYSSGGKRLLKTAYFNDYQTILNKHRPTTLKIIDHMNNDEVTTIKYSNYSLTETPEAYFQASYLKRLK